MRNSTPLTDEQRDLAERNMDLAWWLANKAWIKDENRKDEIESAAMFGLVRAARNFDPSRGMTFSTFAIPRINGEIFESYRSGAPKGFKKVAYRDGWPRIERLDPSDDWIAAEAEHDDDDFEHLIHPLPEKLRDAVRRHYLHGQTQKDIAKSVGLSRSEICRRIKLAIELLTPLT